LRGCEKGRTLIVLLGLVVLWGALSATVFCGGWAQSRAVAVFREELSWSTLFSAIVYWAWALPGAVFGEELCRCALFSALIYWAWAWALPGAVLGEELCWCALFSALVYWAWAWALPRAVLGEELCCCTLFTLVFCGGLALPRAAALAVFRGGSGWCKLSVGVIGSWGIIFWRDIRWWLLLLLLPWLLLLLRLLLSQLRLRLLLLLLLLLRFERLRPCGGVWRCVFTPFGIGESFHLLGMRINDYGFKIHERWG
jgi:hypothetical protein